MQCDVMYEAMCYGVVPWNMYCNTLLQIAFYTTLRNLLQSKAWNNVFCYILLGNA